MVWQHLSTNAAVEEISSSELHAKSSRRKCRPLGRDMSLVGIRPIPNTKESSRDPVRAGGFESWKEVSWSSVVVGLVSTNQAIKDTSSRRGNEQMKSRVIEGATVVEARRRDLMTGENPWNRERGTEAFVASMLIAKDTT